MILREDAVDYFLLEKKRGRDAQKRLQICKAGSWGEKKRLISCFMVCEAAQLQETKSSHVCGLVQTQHREHREITSKHQVQALQLESESVNQGLSSGIYKA